MLKIVTYKIGNKRLIPEGQNYVFCTKIIDTLYVLNSIFQWHISKGELELMYETGIGS